MKKDRLKDSLIPLMDALADQGSKSYQYLPGAVLKHLAYRVNTTIHANDRSPYQTSFIYWWANNFDIILDKAYKDGGTAKEIRARIFPLIKNIIILDEYYWDEYTVPGKEKPVSKGHKL